VRALPRARMIRATIDGPDDAADVYRLRLRRGEKLTADSRHTVRGTVCLAGLLEEDYSRLHRFGRKLRHVARRSGIYQLRLTPTAATRGSYRIAISPR
jgi:hypothetical protein